MGLRHRLEDTVLPADFRIIFGKADNIAQMPASELKDHALVIFTKEIPEKLMDLRPMHQCIVPTDVLFEKWHPDCFKSQDKLGDNITALVKNCVGKRGIIFACQQGELRSRELGITAHHACDKPLFEATASGKLKPASTERCTDLLFRVKGAVYSALSSVEFQ